MSELRNLRASGGDLRRALRALIEAHDERHRLLVWAMERGSAVTQQDTNAVAAALKTANDRLADAYAALDAYRDAALAALDEVHEQQTGHRRSPHTSD